ncbi:MAG: hypothetical protein QXL96_11410 [Ignisphaera sp.]
MVLFAINPWHHRPYAPFHQRPVVSGLIASDKFKAFHAGKEFECVVNSLRNRGLPSFVSRAISSMYYLASANGCKDKDHLQVIKYLSSES